MYFYLSTKLQYFLHHCLGDNAIGRRYGREVWLLKVSVCLTCLGPLAHRSQTLGSPVSEPWLTCLRPLDHLSQTLARDTPKPELIIFMTALCRHIRRKCLRCSVKKPRDECSSMVRVVLLWFNSADYNASQAITVCGQDWPRHHLIQWKPCACLIRKGLFLGRFWVRVVYFPPLSFIILGFTVRGTTRRGYLESVNRGGQATFSLLQRAYQGRRSSWPVTHYKY